MASAAPTNQIRNCWQSKGQQAVSARMPFLSTFASRALARLFPLSKIAIRVLRSCSASARLGKSTCRFRTSRLAGGTRKTPTFSSVSGIPFAKRMETQLAWSATKARLCFAKLMPYLIEPERVARRHHVQTLFFLQLLQTLRGEDKSTAKLRS